MSRRPPVIPAAILSLCCGLAAAEVEGDIPFGFEATTGVRSGYVWRGIDLANSLLDFQAEAEITVAQEFFVNAGGWVASELDDDFGELAGFVGIRHDLSDRLTIGGELTYHDFDDSLLADGFDLGAYLVIHPITDWHVTLGAYHDFAAEGWYAHAQAGWSMRLGEDAFVELLGGLSWTDSYYDRSGLNDFHGRASLTYNVSSAVSLTPFVGWSVEIEDADGDELFGGLWFSVVF